MHVLTGLDSLEDLPDAAAISVGNFDGVHLGHRKIIDTLKARKAIATAVITFEPHPISLLRPNLAPPRLTSPDRKRELLAEAGVTHLIELPASPDVLDLSAEAFWERLRDQARPSAIAEGHDFRFGKRAAGTVEMLQKWAKGTGIDVICVEPASVILPDLHLVHASSSLTRWLLAHGRVTEAARLLGRPYGLTGRVMTGFQRGREIGFPTANIEVLDQLIPADGIYAASATVDGRDHAVALSIGTNPTFNGVHRTIEGHLLDFAGDLYEQPLTLRLHRWLREQVKYDGVDELVAQLHRDVAETRRVVA